MPQFGEVILLRIQFHQATGVVAAPITSQIRNSESDLVIAEWRAAGLNVASAIRVHKLTVLAKAEIVRSPGVLSERDLESLEVLLCHMFCKKAR
jgi:hypothetical protein